VRVEDQLLINTVSGISLTFSSDNQGFIVDSGQGQVRYFSLNAEKSKIAFKKTFTGKGIYPQENLFYKFPNSTGYGYHFEYSAGFFSADNKKIFLNPVSDQWDYRSDLRELSIYDVSTGLLIKKFPYFPDFLGTTLTGTVWLPSLQTFGVLLNNIYTGTTFATLDIQSGSFSKIIDNNKRVRQAVGFSPQGDLLVSAQGNKVFSWDIKNNGYWQLPVDQKVTAGTDYMGSRNISFSPDGKTIAISDLYDGTSFINSVDYSRINITNQNKFFYLKNGYSGCTDGKKIIISSAQGNIINQFDAANITDLDYNETRNILATASIEGLKVWDLSDYSNTKLLFSGKLTSYNLYYGSVRFSPDGKYVAARTYFSADLQQQGVSIWNTETGQLIPDLEVGFVKDLAFFPDSKMIALSINDIFGGSLISIFDLSTGKSIFSTEAGYFQSHFPPSLAFSPDGKFLAVLPAYGYVSIWGIP